MEQINIDELLASYTPEVKPKPKTAPNVGDEYFCLDLAIWCEVWNNTMFEADLIERGNVFSTREEAEQAKKIIIKLLNQINPVEKEDTNA